MNEETLDLRLLNVFDAVYRHGSITRASAELGIAQPTLSNRLRRLRTLLDDPLFVRAPRGMAPTPFAESFAGYAGEALALLEKGLNDRRQFDPETATRTVSIIMTDIAEAVILPRTLEACKRAAPGLSFRTAQIPMAETLDALRSGEVDLAVGYIPELAAGIRQQYLFTSRYVCIASADHPEIRETLDRETFLAARHAVAEARGTGHSVVARVLRDAGVGGRIGVRVPHFLSLPLIVAASDMVATVPLQMAHLFDAVAPVRSFPHPLEFPPLEIRLFWHERFQHDPASRWLRGLFRDVFGTMGWD